MPIIQVTTSLGAGLTNDNVLTGSQYEYLPFNAVLEFGQLTDAAGVLTDVYSGTDLLAEGAAVALDATVGKLPVYPDHFMLNDVARGGERLKVRYRNTSGATRTIQTVVRITPV